MRSLTRINPSKQAAAEALPDVLDLARHGIHIRKAQTTMIAAEPGVGKTVLALGGFAIPWAQHGLRSLYVSADSDEYTMLKRAVAAVTGQPQRHVETMFQEGRSEWGSSLADLPGGISFTFETDPAYVDLDLEAIAHFEAWGEYPDAIFIDNLSDLVGENEDEFGTLRDSTRALKRLARKTGSAVVILHHVNEKEGRPNSQPPPRSDITGKVSKKSELTLTIAVDDDIMRIAPVKNREGKQDRSAQYSIPVRVDFERVRFSALDHTPFGRV